MLESADKFDINVDLIAYGKKWEGYDMKINELYNYLKTLNENDIVCFFDAYDVLFCNSQEKLKSMFLELEEDHNIIIGCHEPPGRVIDYYMNNIYNYDYSSKIPTKYKYLCSGTIIGRAKYLKQALELHDTKYADDQVFWNYLYREHEELKIELDYKNKLFFTSSPPKNIINFVTNYSNNDDLEFNGKNIINKYTNTTPVLIHSPGDADMSEFHEYLNLSESKGDHGSRLVKKFNNYSKNLSLSALAISFLIIFLTFYILYRNIYAGIIAVILLIYI